MILADQKKILILGGTKHMIDAVEEAKRMGMFPIVVDDIIGAPAKDFADKSFNINAADTQKLAEIVEEEKVVGVYTAFEDINTWNAIALCKLAGLPFYAAKTPMPIKSDKEKFKEICRRFNVSVIEQYEIAVEFEEIAVSAWEFPLLVKPIKSNAEKKKAFATVDLK